MKKWIAGLLLICCLSLAMVSCTEPEDTGETAEYTFRYQNQTVAIGDEAEPVLRAFGEYRDMEATGSCAFEEQDRTYTYGGFEMLTCFIDGKYRVRMIKLYDDTVATPEGIRIGSSRADVIRAYGDADEESGGNLRYTGKDMTFTVFFEGDTVSSIRYMGK